MGGANTVTVTFTVNTQSVVMLAEFSGMATASSLDVTFGGTGTSTAIASATSATLAQADELIIGVGGHWSSTATITPNSPATEIGESESASTGMPGWMAYKIVAATTATTIAWTGGASTDFAVEAAAFKAAAGGGGPVALPPKAKIIRQAVSRAAIR